MLLLPLSSEFSKTLCTYYSTSCSIAVTVTSFAAASVAKAAITNGGSVTVKLQRAGVQPSHFHTSP